ncbi:heavy-metal-associated domain-containing protein [Anatilimnocola floriformis]|uniref:heavy-metal-associated domain-containing protein n=1 Tax=Anatilimnocola floriformis TaxID=2948575 RepID=UPI0020C31069|nr:heavy-metal-associated domain-containing protein [Anatilimnocola floriformis]
MKFVAALACALSLMFAVGCNRVAAPMGEAAAEVTPPPPAGVQLVKLKLPGMVCGGCAMEVKDTLVKVDGISHVATNPDKHECTFWFAKGNDEIKTKLDDLAKTNDKIAGWEREN